MTTKQRIADWLQRSAVLQAGLKLAVRVLVPRHPVGAVGAVLNDAGKILLVEHVFHPRCAWGLPGGWIKYGECPSEGLQRELKEELSLHVDVKDVLYCERQDQIQTDRASPGLLVAYYCRPAAGAGDLAVPGRSFEILSARWVDTEQLPAAISPMDRKAIALAIEQFRSDQARGM